MITTPPANLEDAIRRSGEGWVIDWFDPPSQSMNHIRQALAAVNQRAEERLGGNAPNLTESALLAEYRRNPERVRGFFQALGLSRTPDMLLMVWRVIQGMDIKSVELSYVRQQSFELRAILESPYGEEDEPYHSTDIDDFKLFRHIGIFKLGANPVFDGFYPLKARG